MDNLKEQFKFMFNHLINELDAIERLTNKYRWKGELPFNKIKFENYDVFRTRSFFYFNKINNIIGDSQNEASSYKKLRKKIAKQLNVELSYMNQENNEIINDFYHQRNWSVHFTGNEYQAEVDLNPAKYEGHKYYINRPKYVTRELYLDLIHSNWNEINKARYISNLMIEDYYILFGEYPEIYLYEEHTMGIEGLEKAELSFAYSKKKRKKNN